MLGQAGYLRRSLTSFAPAAMATAAATAAVEEDMEQQQQQQQQQQQPTVEVRIRQVLGEDHVEIVKLFQVSCSSKRDL